MGHRGASAHAPDNSADAFRLAGEHGADGVELDVRFTADDVIVLCHDPEIPGFGVVNHHTFEELRAARPQVITLDEGAALLEGLILNIEIKNHPTEPDFDPDHRMADQIAQWIAAGDRYGLCVVTSFNPDTVARVRVVDEAVITGQLLDRSADLGAAIPEAAAAGHSYIAPHKRLLRARPAKVVDTAANQGLGVAVWTVDRTKQLRRLADAGVSAVIANDPKAALELYSERSP